MNPPQSLPTPTQANYSSTRWQTGTDIAGPGTSPLWALTATFPTAPGLWWRQWLQQTLCGGGSVELVVAPNLPFHGLTPVAGWETQQSQSAIGLPWQSPGGWEGGPC